MRVSLNDFDSSQFSLHEHPVLVLQNFWSAQEMARFRRAMQDSSWTERQAMPDTSKSFRGCGNWLKADIVDPERSALVERILMPFVADYVDSFADAIGRVVNFNYYSYSAGDCLTLHTDERSDRRDDERRLSIIRRVALATYFHESWDANWGGELIIYEKGGSGRLEQGYEIADCISPDPGSLVLFTVPRHHRVCRVDPLAGDSKRLSIAGWFMTDHAT